MPVARSAGLSPSTSCQLSGSAACAGLLAPLLAGAAVILPAGGRFSAKTFWRDAGDYGATFYTAVPTMHQVRLHICRQLACSSNPLAAAGG